MRTAEQKRERIQRAERRALTNLRALVSARERRIKAQGEERKFASEVKEALEVLADLGIDGMTLEPTNLQVEMAIRDHELNMVIGEGS